MNLIDADALRSYWLENGKNECVYDTNAVLDSIDLAPTIEAELVRHGQWVDGGEGIVVCSECGEEHCWEDYRAAYCDSCGAKMDLEGTE